MGTRAPGVIPIFRYRAAFTRELYDQIVEFRLTSTAHGLAEHFKRKYWLCEQEHERNETDRAYLLELHTYEYHSRESEYLDYVRNRLTQQGVPGQKTLFGQVRTIVPF